MSDGLSLTEVHEVERKCLLMEQILLYSVQSLELLDSEELSLSNNLSKFNSEINNLNTKKSQLEDQIKCSIENDVETIEEKIKFLNRLRARLDLFNRHKRVLEEHSLKRGLEVEGKMLKEKINSVWTYSYEKNSKLDEEIAHQEAKYANRKYLAIKTYENESKKCKKSIEKLKNENNILEKKLVLLG